jgi:hypothetical protein
MLVNDLDLRLTDAFSTTYYSYKLDRSNPSDAATHAGENDIDNGEIVYIPNPSPGIYTITVGHDGTLSGGSQAFSMIISGVDDYSSAPSCSDGMTYPSDGATDVLLNTELFWSEVWNAENYLLFVGTDGGGNTTPTNFLNGTVVGENSYQLLGLNADETYYVQIVPQNSISTASSCSIYSFSTETPISSYPYVENFDGITAPNLVSGWSSQDNGDAFWQTSTLTSKSSANSMLCYLSAGGSNAYNMDMDNWLFSSTLYMQEGYKYDLSFYYRCYNDEYPEKLEVMVGILPSSSSMETSIFNDDNITAITSSFSGYSSL